MGFVRATAFLICLHLICFQGLAGCRSEPAANPGPAEAGTATVLVPAAGKTITFRVEVARTPAEHKRGLMYRQQLAQDAGMLFIGERPEVLTFWMKNVSIPLDIIFIDAGRKIVGVVENAEPLSLTPREVPIPSLYVLEINGGLSSRLGITFGKTVEFRGFSAP